MADRFSLAEFEKDLDDLLDDFEELGGPIVAFCSWPRALLTGDLLWFAGSIEDFGDFLIRGDGSLSTDFCEERAFFSGGGDNLIFGCVASRVSDDELVAAKLTGVVSKCFRAFESESVGFEQVNKGLEEAGTDERGDEASEAGTDIPAAFRPFICEYLCITSAGGVRAGEYSSSDGSWSSIIIGSAGECR